MAIPSAQSGHLCDAGRHVIDPNWDSCPYCNGEKRSEERIRSDQPRSATAASSSDRKTTVGSAAASSERATKTMPIQPTKTMSIQPSRDFGGSGGKGETRKIVGILITYTWNPAGKLWRVREGKNYIGAGNVSSETPHEPCHIQIKEDEELSSEHALILYRGGEFEIVDQKSSNGTFLNDRKVPIQGTVLPDKAEILTGSTVWTFMKIDSGKTPGVEHAPARPSQPEPRKEEAKKPAPEKQSTTRTKVR